MESEIANLLRQTSGLTGRKIAKELGLEKREVNSFLYSHGNGLFVQRDNLWFVEDRGIEICFDQGKWLAAPKFEELIFSTQGFSLEPSQPVTFRFVECNILLDAISRLLALVNQLASNGVQVTLDFTNCKTSFSYLCRVGLFEVIDCNVTVVPEILDYSDHYGQNKKVMEFVSIPSKTKNTDLPLKLKSAFIELAGSQHSNTAFSFMSEFVNNIIEHSNTPIPGFAALQVYNGTRKKIQTVFSDCGDGIIGTLRPVLEQRYPHLHDKYPKNIPEMNSKLLKEMFEFGGVSGADDEEYKGRGLGMKVGADVASKFNAKIRVRQDTFELTLNYVDGQLQPSIVNYDLINLEGTHICFDFYL